MPSPPVICHACDNPLLPGKIRCVCGAWNPGTKRRSKDAPHLGLRRLSEGKDIEKVFLRSGRAWDANFSTIRDPLGNRIARGTAVESVHIISAQPGAGKSTMLDQLMNDICEANPSRVTLRICTEEGFNQLSERA